MTDFPHIRVSGGPRDRGRQYGEQARDRVRLSVAAYREVFGELAGWDWPTVVEQAGRFAEPIRQFGAGYLEEIHGIAEGAGLDVADVLAVNVRTEIMFAARARAALADSQRPGECSSFAVLPGRSADGHTLVGQNWDWLLHTFDTCVVLEVQQEGLPDFVTVVEAGLLAKTGMNSSGVGIATNALVTRADLGVPGVPYHVLLRGLFDSENASDALATLQRGTRSSSANYLIASADGLAVDVEAAPGDFSDLSLVFPDDGLILHTNHFLSPSFRGTDVSVWAMPDSPFRLARLRSFTDDMHTLALADFQRYLADHANHPSGVCCHPDRRLAGYDQAATVASVLLDLDARVMWLADGNPCSTAYRRLDYADFLGKPSPVGAGRDIEVDA